MPILGAMQSAAIRLTGRRPATFFSSSNTFEMEVADLANEVAHDICKSHDWQALIRIHTIEGDGETTSFPFPSDYDRMLVKSDLQDESNWAWGYNRIHDINEWMYLTNSGFNTVTPGSWMVFDGAFQFVPAPANGAKVQFPYISRHYAAVGEDRKARFTNDNDDFLISERLLTLGIIWKWREQKRLDATGDQANFEKAFNELAGRDKGSRILATGPARLPGNVSVAYPFALGS